MICPQYIYGEYCVSYIFLVLTQPSVGDYILGDLVLDVTPFAVKLAYLDL